MAADDPSRRYVNAHAVDVRCEVGTRRSESSSLATDIDDFEITLAPGSGFIFIERQQLELPAGPAAEKWDGVEGMHDVRGHR